MQFHLEDMTCGGCARTVTKTIQMIDPNAKIVPGGKLYAGTGLGSIIDPSRFEIASQHPELGRAFIAGDASNSRDGLKGQIEVDNLGEALRDRIDKIYETVNEKVKEVIRSELRPGCLLHR